jgi:XTP/dITP diphosphohydrolase
MGQPALSLAAQLQRRAERAGASVDLEKEAPGVTEFGAELFALVARARAAGADPEFELRAAARAYRDQVQAWEKAQEQEHQESPADQG